MKEMISTHDDLDKRLAIFFGLGAFIMSALVGIVRDYTLEGFLLQGVVVLALATLGGYAFGAWLRAALASVAPKVELPANVERRSSNPNSLAEGTVVMPEGQNEATIDEEPLPGQPGSVVNFTLPELNPADLLNPPPLAAAPTLANAVAVPVGAGSGLGGGAAVEDPGEDLPPPPVPSGLK
jgi:hypothetical protein